MPEEDFHEKFKKLPSDLKKLFVSEEIALVLKKIGEEENIPESQIEDMKIVIGNVLLGDLPLTEFKDELEKELNINEEARQNLVRKLEKEIFSKHKISLDKLYQSGATEQKNLAELPPKSTKTEEEKELKEILAEEKRSIGIEPTPEPEIEEKPTKKEDIEIPDEKPTAEKELEKGKLAEKIPSETKTELDKEPAEKEDIKITQEKTEDNKKKIENEDIKILEKELEKGKLAEKIPSETKTELDKEPAEKEDIEIPDEKPTAENQIEKNNEDEELQEKKKLLQKKGADLYREPINDEKDVKTPRAVKEKGKIKKLL